MLYRWADRKMSVSSVVANTRRKPPASDFRARVWPQKSAGTC